MTLANRLRHPRTTVRWRLTLLYGGLFLASGAVLLAITYTLVAHATITNGPFGGPAVQLHIRATPNALVREPGLGFQTVRGVPVPKLTTVIRRLLRSPAGRTAVSFVGPGQRISDLHQLVIESAIALAIMAVISAALGWLVAGRALNPVRTMTAATRQISEANLHQRLAMSGPPDEFHELGDTIDGLLGRLEGAFDAQRRFVANASHELRTPLTSARALLEMVVADPGATVDTFRETARQVLEESEQQEQLIDALLALAQGQRGLGHSESLDLAAIVADVLVVHEPAATALGLRFDVSLAPAPFSGDRRLVERLVSNLIDNAVSHNLAQGEVRVEVGTQAGQATLAVVNTGPLVPADEVDRLLQPFQRMGADRVSQGDGVGLGLSIVAAVADAHDAGLHVQPGIDGGLRVEVRFASAPGDGPAEPDLALTSQT